MAPPGYASDVHKAEVVPGRIAVFRCVVAGRKIAIANVHLEPGLPAHLIRAHLRRLALLLQECSGYIVFVVGDFNFVDPEEGRLSLPEATLTFRHDEYYISCLSGSLRVAL